MMAKTTSDLFYYKFMQSLMCLELFIFLCVSSAKFCNIGRNVESMEALLNQSCATNKTQIAESLIATEYIHKDKRNTNASSHRIDRGSPTKYCYIFRHISTETLSLGYEKESLRTVYGCDFDHVCDGKEMNTIMFSVPWQGEHGKLFCCEEENCNTIEKMPRTPVENQICFSGSSNNSKVGLESCTHPETYCVTKTQFFKDGKHDTYSCDSEKSCDKQDRHGAFKFCQNTTEANVTTQSCCCVGNKCNLPSDRSLVRSLLKGHQDGSAVISTDSWKKILHPITNPLSKDKSKSLVTGLVASIVVIALAGIGVLFYLAYKRRKRREGGVRHDPNVIMQYERLSCSDASLEGSVGV